MTNIQHNKPDCKYLPLDYRIDSWKLLIDLDRFKSVDIPENYTLICTDTGEELDSFKRKSIPLKYKNTTIYLGKFIKILPNKRIEKVAILFSSKVAEHEYFGGIRKHHLDEVMQFLQISGYIDFDDDIYKYMFVKDLDIKKDIIIPDEKALVLNDFNKELKKRFNGSPDKCLLFNNRARGCGIQVSNRLCSTFKVPFCKFYNKNSELIGKSKDFFNTFPSSYQRFILSRYIYRYEFTLKDVKWFKKFNLSNNVLDVLEISNEKWNEVGRWFLNTNFQPVMKNIREIGKIKPSDKAIALFIIRLMEKGDDLNFIRNLYISAEPNIDNAHRMKKRFERIYAIVTQKEAEYSKEIAWMGEFDKMLGFS